MIAPAFDLPSTCESTRIEFAGKALLLPVSTCAPLPDLLYIVDKPICLALTQPNLTEDIIRKFKFSQQPELIYTFFTKIRILKKLLDVLNLIGVPIDVDHNVGDVSRETLSFRLVLHDDNMALQ
jgi:hypothetical protein